MKKRRGIVAMLVLVMIGVLLGFASLTIDIGAVYATKADLQKVADSSSLASVQVVGDEYEDFFAVANAIAALNPVFAHGPITLAKKDCLSGNFDIETGVFTAGDIPLNAVSVVARRENKEEANGALQLFFAPIFGMTEKGISASAIAMMPPLKKVNDTTPLSLRSPGFGIIDPSIAIANPGKDGPSEPSDQLSFRIGEKVTVFAFGKGKKSSVHLVLNTNDILGEEQLGKVMSGSELGVAISVGDALDVVGDGTGHNGLGVKLASRLDDGNPDNDIIVMPVVSPIMGPGECDGACQPTFGVDGKLSGDVLVVDFVAVRLDMIESVSVSDPNKSGSFIDIELLVGTVVRLSVSGDIANETSGFVDGSVFGAPQLVK